MATIQDLMNMIPNGRANAIHAPELATRLGLSTGGTQEATRVLVRKANLQGEMIVNTLDEGFWLSNDKQEVIDYINALYSRIQGTLDRINALKSHWNASHPNNLI